jgi:hypothetical protein
VFLTISNLGNDSQNPAKLLSSSIRHSLPRTSRSSRALAC